ncbi:MAG: hypothetical protein V2A75_04105 [Pseudomonadota bacterium]
MIILEGLISWVVLYALYFAAKEGLISILVAIVGAVIFFAIIPVTIKALVMMITVVYFVTRSLFSQPQEA